MDTTNAKLLIVEDTQSINKLLSTSLEQKLGIEILSCLTMAEAKVQVEKHNQNIYLAILDLTLPDAPRGEIVDYILQQKIPSIVLTNVINDEVQDKMMKKGIIDYVIKRNFNDIEYVTDYAQRLFHNFNRKALVVDDTLVSRMLIVALLKKMNFQIIEAGDGVEALKQLQSHDDVDLIITDLNMPNMDGMELIYKIREKYTRNQMAIIGISATTDGSASTKLLKSGANDFINRPFAHEEFSCRINQTIDAISNYRKLEDSSNRDFLTGLYNRKFLFESGYKLLKNAQRNNFLLSVAMIDIDFFKRINDTFGHDAGDLALKHISRLLKKQLRDGDILARFGGEEFCVLVVTQDTAGVQDVLERARKTIMTHPFTTGNKEIPVTVSIGYTSIMTNSLDKMISCADKALYEAKHNGRNRVVRCEEG